MRDEGGTCRTKRETKRGVDPMLRGATLSVRFFEWHMNQTVASVPSIATSVNAPFPFVRPKDCPDYLYIHEGDRSTDMVHGELGRF